MLAVYVYFTISVIGNQFVDEATELDMYIPYFAFIEVIHLLLEFIVDVVKIP